ncbi:MAG TPA: 50S ribosomal protein L4 [Acidimicrobiales bacterium]|nr:50S ribosomal protein L4 [Acidimicrobiales bacterium]
MATSPVSSPSVDLRKSDGTVVATHALDAQTFGIQPNVPVMHQVVTAQLAAARSGTQSTRTRAEVNGGGAKPWRQKGTGRARQGSSRAPHWTGGGVALGPKPRSYKQKTPKKMVALALRSALSDRAAQGQVAVVESWGIDRARTKDALGLLATLGVDAGKVLVVVAPDDHAATLSFRNLPHVHVLLGAELNAYDVLCADWVVFSSATLPGGLGETVAASAASSAPPAPVPAPDTAAPAPATAAPAEAAPTPPAAADPAAPRDAAADEEASE